MEQQITISNKLGLHARAAAKLVALATSYQSTINLCKENKSVNAKSIMAVLMLAASKGTNLVIRAEGEDEIDALTALVTLIDNKFDEGE